MFKTWANVTYGRGEGWKRSRVALENQRVVVCVLLYRGKMLLLDQSVTKSVGKTGQKIGRSALWRLLRGLNQVELLEWGGGLGWKKPLKAYTGPLILIWDAYKVGMRIKMSHRQRSTFGRGWAGCRFYCLVLRWVEEGPVASLWVKYQPASPAVSVTQSQLYEGRGLDFAVTFAANTSLILLMTALGGLAGRGWGRGQSVCILVPACIEWAMHLETYCSQSLDFCKMGIK